MGRDQYRKPSIDQIGTVAEFTQALGIGPGSDNAFPQFIQENFPKFNAAFTTS